MTTGYTVSGELVGRLCAGVSEPLAGAGVRLYRAQGGGNGGFGLLEEAAVEARQADLLAEAEADERGAFSVVLSEDRYHGEALEVDCRLAAVPGMIGAAPSGAPLEFSLTRFDPEWRDTASGAATEWRHELAPDDWCAVRARLGAWVICGRLATCDANEPIAGAVVRAFDADLLEDDPLGGAPTDADGRFRVDYAPEAFKRTPLSPVFDVELVGGPDLYFSAELEGRPVLDEDRSIARSPARENAGPCFCVELCSELPVLAISIDSPASELVTNQAAQLIMGRLSAPAELTIAGEPVPLGADHSFSYAVTLDEGPNLFELVATDPAGLTASETLSLTLDTVVPDRPRRELLAVGAVAVGEVAITGAPGCVESEAEVRATNTRTAETRSVPAGLGGHFAVRIGAKAGDRLSLVVADAAGNTSPPVEVEVGPEAPGLPPDPADVAPSLDPTLGTDLASSTAFLYSGDEPIQTNVVPGAIEPVRAAGLRGQVTERDGQPLPGVAVTVLDHPEYGQTLSRADGVFDLAVNGGGFLTVRYAKAGYLPAQRQVDVPWQDYAWLPYVALVRPDGAVTPIELRAADGFQIARGVEVSDADGTRRTTLLFRPDTHATMTLPDGSSQTLDTLRVRATEHTVGDGGPQAMPAELPATSGYTYAVELTADEALTAAATELRFDPPVVTYVENFLRFPVGGPVPTGFYDRRQGTWVAVENGLVVAIVGEANGKAELDLDGDGTAAEAGALEAFGITDPEREVLAALYQPGATLWRVETNHFTPWDCNFPYGPPDDAEPPVSPDPTVQNPATDRQSRKCGSIIGCERQTLGETVGVTGTPFSLRYQSDRVSGRRDAYTLEIPVVGPTVPRSLVRVELEITVAGRRFRPTIYPPTPNLTHSFAWDGKDAYGRTVQGAQPVTVRLGYVYPVVYRTPDQVARSFARVSGTGTTIDAFRSSAFITSWRVWRGYIGALDAVKHGLGGWSLDVQHVFDPADRTLYQGDGGRRTAAGLPPVIGTVAGGGSPFAPWGDGGPADQAFGDWVGVATGPDGSIYIADLQLSRIRKVDPAGIITTFAGSVGFGFAGDGGPATSAQLSFPRDVAVGPEGSVYVADDGNRRLRRIGGDGVITTVAGTGAPGFGGDGGPATDASFNSVFGVAVDRDGTVYVADLGSHCIRRIGTDGTITTVAGLPGVCGFGGDGGPAGAATLCLPRDVAVGPDGSLYIADTANHRIRRVGTDGIIRTVAGTGAGSYGGDGGQATNAQLHSPHSITVAPDGTLYIAHTQHSVVRRVTPDGVITTMAGVGLPGGFAGDGGPAAQARLDFPTGLALAPDGSLYIADRTRRLRQVRLPFPGFSGADIAIASEDGSKLYQFDYRGRHLSTRDTVTGAVLLKFGYDDAGRLTRVDDVDANVTTVERAPDGSPTAIVAPGGQRTTLAVNAGGYLTRIANPAEEALELTYTSEGLLTSLTDPRGGQHRFTYDALGRLTKAEDPAGGSKTLRRTTTPNGYEVAVESTIGRVTTFRLERLPTGVIRRAVVDPSGAETEAIRALDGSLKITGADGTVTRLVEGPDPRFGMHAPVVTSETDEMPSGLTRSLTRVRSVILAEQGDPLSLETFSETVTVNGRSSSLAYDSATRAWTLTSPEGRMSRSVLDPKGRVVTDEPAPGIEPITYTYDAIGRLTEIRQGSEFNTFEYDVTNRLTASENALGERTHYVYDAADRIIAATSPSGRTQSFAYDRAGSPVSLTPPSGVQHRLGYTARGELGSYTPPGNAAMSWGYDRDRALARISLPSGRIIDVSYDADGRLTGTVNAEDAAVSVDYVGATSRVAQTVRTPVGGAGQALSFTYDGALVKSITWTGAVQGSFLGTFDANGFLTSMRLASGTDDVDTAITYDRDGLQTGHGPFALLRSGPAGAVSAIRDVSLELALSYDALARLTHRDHKVATRSFYRETYAYDGLGRIVEKTEATDEGTRTITYDYDPDGRIVEVRIDGAATERYGYDANGNLTTRAIGTGSPAGATYDAQDRITRMGAVAYESDTDGFLTKRGTDSFAYGARAELLRAQVGGNTVTYAYDGLGRRVTRTDRGGTVQYLYGNPANFFELTAARDAAGELTSFYYDESGLLFALERKGSRFYVATDQIGTPRAVASSTGIVVKSLRYDAFGNLVSDSKSAFFLPIGFAGGLADTLTGLVRFGWRDYDPTAGRWTAPDPILFDGGQTNLYSYVGSDPINNRDASGLIPYRVTPDGDIIKYPVWAREWGSPQTRITRAGRGFGRVGPALPLLSHLLDAYLGYRTKEAERELEEAFKEAMRPNPFGKCPTYTSEPNEPTPWAPGKKNEWWAWEDWSQFVQYEWIAYQRTHGREDEVRRAYGYRPANSW
jgi:RHS repeat-associated protein